MKISSCVFLKNLLITLFGLINLIHFTFELKARCFLIPDNDSGVSGLVEFDQEDAKSPVKVKGKIYGATAIHGFHIHEFGNIKGGCMSTGNHYNPTNMTHGGPKDEERHNGDLGNVEAEKNIINIEVSDSVISLFGDTPIYGKACVIHAKRDDLGRGEGQSKINGNAGARTACGIVQQHNPLKSILFGTVIVVIGVALLIYYFFFRKQEESTLIKNEENEKNY